MTPEQITSHWLSSVFDADVELTDSARVGDGLVGMNLRLSLGSRDPEVPPTVIAKLPSPDPTSRATGIALRNYEREVKFYAEIAPTVAIRVPRCFHGDWTAEDGDFVLLLEDLAPAQQGDQIAGCDDDIARRSVLELARLHGPRWADPKLADYEFLSRRTPDDSAAADDLDDVPARLPAHVREVSRQRGSHLDQSLRRAHSRLGRGPQLAGNGYARRLPPRQLDV